MEELNYSRRHTVNISLVGLMGALAVALVVLIWFMIFTIVEVYTNQGEIQGAGISFALLVILGMVISALVLSILERIIRNRLDRARSQSGFVCCIYDGNTGSCTCCIRSHFPTQNIEQLAHGTYPMHSIQNADSPDSGSYLALQGGMRYVPHPSPQENGDLGETTRSDDEEHIYETMAGSL